MTGWQAVHNISLNCEKLLSYTLNQQNVSEPTVSVVANILSMKVWPRPRGSYF